MKHALHIDDAEVELSAIRAQGPGGQNVNKVESAIRITHVPTGIIVACQNQRSQHKNKAEAMNQLRARLKLPPRRSGSDEYR